MHSTYIQQPVSTLLISTIHCRAYAVHWKKNNSRRLTSNIKSRYLNKVRHSSRPILAGLGLRHRRFQGQSAKQTVRQYFGSLPRNWRVKTGWTGPLKIFRPRCTCRALKKAKNVNPALAVDYRERAPIQLAQWWFPGLIKIYFWNKIHESNFIKQHSKTVTVWN